LTFDLKTLQPFIAFFLKLHQCIEVMGDGCLNNEHFEELGGILKAKLEEHFKNQELRQGRFSMLFLAE
jgi:hypothetical protein